MQKIDDRGGKWYTKLCADEWYCERNEGACSDLDGPEYAYLDCNVGCCTDNYCNDVQGVRLSSLVITLTTIFTVVASLYLW